MKHNNKTAFLSILLSALLILSMTACGRQEVPEPSAPAPTGENETAPTEPSDTHIPTGENTGEPAQAASHTSAVDLLSGITPADTAPTDSIPAASAAAVTDFSVRLLQQAMDKTENLLLSPLSVLCALSMTANGAKGETLAQIEQAAGLSRENLNQCIGAYMAASDTDGVLHLANSVWLKDDPQLQVEPSFLQAVADGCQAGVFKAPFDQNTLSDINSWVSGHTKDMIPHMLDEIPSDAKMYLINALSFDAEWQNKYTREQTLLLPFTDAQGDSHGVWFLCDKEFVYLEDENTTGFLKYYAGGNYAFAALLPGEDMPLDSYVASLTGDKISSLLTGSTSEPVLTQIPKFHQESSLDLAKSFKAMGITHAFGPSADFTAMASAPPLFITGALHKTYLTLDQSGTKAGAATAIEMNSGAAMVSEQKEVYLDRPFVYMIVDRRYNIPIFMGTVLELA